MFPQFLGKQHLLDEISLQIIRYVINMQLQQFFVYFCCRKVCCSSTIRETMQPTGRQVCNHSPLWVVVWITVLAKGNMLVCDLSDHLETIIQIVIANRRTRQKKNGRCQIFAEARHTLPSFFPNPKAFLKSRCSSNAVLLIFHKRYISEKVIQFPRPPPPGSYIVLCCRLLFPFVKMFKRMR